jgi:hypothetical protein
LRRHRNRRQRARTRARSELTVVIATPTERGAVTTQRTRKTRTRAHDLRLGEREPPAQRYREAPVAQHAEHLSEVARRGVRRLHVQQQPDDLVSLVQQGAAGMSATHQRRFERQQAIGHRRHRRRSNVAAPRSSLREA